MLKTLVKQAKTSPNHKDRLAKLKVDYEQVFSTDAGKRVLEDIAKSGKLQRPSYSNDANELLIDEGRRDLAFHIVDMAEPRAEVKEEDGQYST